MKSWKQFLAAGWLVLGSLGLPGCSPPSGSADEEKEPQFLIGRSHVNTMDYASAVSAFEQALEQNPHSGAAHFELGWLYAEKEVNPAAAIYHYEKFLQLRPNADNSETIRQHIFRLKQELAKGVLSIPPSSEVQRQVENLAEENRRLKEELEQWKKSVGTQQTSTNRVPQQGQMGGVNPSARTNAGPARAIAEPGLSARTATRTAQTQVLHKVQSGETVTSIARKYKLSTDALLKANPGLNPRKMKIGQSVTIPAG